MHYCRSRVSHVQMSQSTDLGGVCPAASHRTSNVMTRKPVLLTRRFRISPRPRTRLTELLLDSPPLIFPSACRAVARSHDVQGTRIMIDSRSAYKVQGSLRKIAAKSSHSNAQHAKAESAQTRPLEHRPLPVQACVVCSPLPHHPA